MESRTVFDRAQSQRARPQLATRRCTISPVSFSGVWICFHPLHGLIEALARLSSIASTATHGSQEEPRRHPLVPADRFPKRVAAAGNSPIAVAGDAERKPQIASDLVASRRPGVRVAGPGLCRHAAREVGASRSTRDR